jgi:hypothetical protein
MREDLHLKTRANEVTMTFRHVLSLERVLFSELTDIVKMQTTPPLKNTHRDSQDPTHNSRNDIGGLNDPSLSPRPAPQSTKKKLGHVGGPKLPPKGLPSSSPKQTAPPPQMADLSSIKDQSPVRDISPPTASKTAPSPAPRRKAGLGVVGGKQKRQTPTPEPEPAHQEGTSPKPVQPEAAISPKPVPKPKLRLGTIGGKDRSATQPKENPSHPSAATTLEPGNKEKVSSLRPKTPDPQNQPKIAPKDDSPPPEEVEGRADRKRQELKRELDAKVKAPVKKKRKF